MALHAQDPDTDPDWLDEWPLGVRRPFMTSQAFNVLQRDLRRYLRGEVAGRSMLISGHRGAGKTALVLRAIQDCEREVMADAVRPVDPRKRSLPPQRPLLVKLHGPTLLAIDAAAPAAAASEPAAPAPAVVVTATATTAAAATTEGKAVPPAATTLSLITIALYRALAAEAAKAYAIHAREEQALRGGDFAEVAGQLVLELDRAPPPASIRAFWARLGRLGPGVLWPRAAHWRGEEGAVNDQGVREVIALATAAQAFRVCTGKEQDTEKDSGAASDEQARSTEAKLDLADAANKLLGLTAGAAATAALYAVNHALTPGELAAGVVVGMVSSLSLGWTSKRRLARKMTREYTFIPDRSPQNLDRDLPLVIERIRAAGLAPVFVIDELDKVDDGQRRIGDFINDLKHLITDFGFFCFLTDRDYFEYVQRTLNSAAFPKEHTYFSQRQFILYRPDEFKAYLGQILASDDGEANAADQLALKVFPLVLLHRSKLNTVAVVREVARASDKDGRLRAESGTMNTVLAYRLPATVQLAIDHILRGAELAERLEAEPVFAQMMIDALYRISRAWEDEATEINCSPDAVRMALAQRIKRAKVEDAAEARTIIGDVLGEVDLRMIFNQSDRLLGYLTDFASLAADLQRTPPPEGIEAARILPLDITPGLLARKGPDGTLYSFLFDAFGLDQRAPVGAAATGDEAALLRVVEAFRRFCEAAGVEPEQLAAVGALPATLDWGEILRAAALLKAAHDDDPASRAAVTTLRALHTFLRRRGRVFAMILWVARQVANDAEAGGSGGMQAALEAMNRYDPLAQVVGSARTLQEVCAWCAGERPTFKNPAPPIAATETWLGAVGRQLGAAATPARREDPEQRQQRVITRWANFFREAPHTSPDGWPKTYDNVVVAAAGLWPSCFLRDDGMTVSLLEWSELALVALTATDAGVERAWIALRAFDVLGFGRGALSGLGDSGLVAPQLAPELVVAITAGGQPNPGVGLLVGDGPSIAREPPAWASPRSPPHAESEPILAIPKDRVGDYIGVLNWLIERGVVTQILEEA